LPSSPISTMPPWRCHPRSVPFVLNDQLQSTMPPSVFT
jgi:hypothetical protein